MRYEIQYTNIAHNVELVEKHIQPAALNCYWRYVTEQETWQQHYYNSEILNKYTNIYFSNRQGYN